MLFVEDQEDDVVLIVRQLERAGYAVESLRVDTRDSYVNALANATWDAVICDHSLPQFGSREALTTLQARELDYPFIIVSADPVHSLV